MPTQRRRGGLPAANSTVSLWEGFSDTVANIAEIKRLIRVNAGLLTLVRTAADIEAAQCANKTGIILEFQNAQALEDDLGTIEA
ncbi:MAG: membrane dipeptidase [Steroidobacteraceae bacterium]